MQIIHFLFLLCYCILLTDAHFIYSLLLSIKIRNTNDVTHSAWKLVSYSKECKLTTLLWKQLSLVLVILTLRKQATPQKSLPIKLKRVKIKAFYIITGILDISWHAEKESHHFPLSWEWIIHVKENVYSNSFGITQKHSLTCKDHWCSLP